MYKHLLTSGCSFTCELYKPSWPTYTSKELGTDLINVGMGSTGNGLIARKVIINVEKLLKLYSSDEILVGVMWSGPDRIHRFKGNSVPVPVVAPWMENPTNLWPDGEKVWEIGNGCWDTDFDKVFLKYIHTNEDAYMNTVDNILLVQNYLKAKGINYFMSTFLNIFEYVNKLHVDVQEYFKFIDLSKFADTQGCFEWCRDNQINFEYTGEYKDGWTHPISEGYKAYSEQVLVPFILNNNV